MGGCERGTREHRIQALREGSEGCQRQRRVRIYWSWSYLAARESVACGRKGRFLARCGGDGTQRCTLRGRAVCGSNQPAFWNDSKERAVDMGSSRGPACR